MTRLTISGAYTEDWAIVSLRVRDEASWRCVRCRHPFDRETGRPLPCAESIIDPCDPRRCKAKRIAARGGLVTAHNYGIHHFDGDKGNNAWWNLMALCNSCHLYVQASVIPERAFMFHHSEWAIVYVCGYYAHAKGIAITRGDALIDPDRYLRMGQPWLYADTLRDEAELMAFAPVSLVGRSRRNET